MLPRRRILLSRLLKVTFLLKPSFLCRNILKEALVRLGYHHPPLQIAVCIIELWPEARACRDDRALAIGCFVGAAVMGWTLMVEGA